MATHKQDEIARLNCGIPRGGGLRFEAETWRPISGQNQAGFEWDGVIVALPNSVTGADIQWDAGVGTASVQLRPDDFVYTIGSSGGQAGVMFSIANPGTPGMQWATVKIAFYSDGHVHNTTRLNIYADPPDGES